ncbi:hypothetical protein CspHIS471_0302030 [Cutaneotrichosporon sp. HIS471]|nr:hypothetical protein CspHIS471_0302030 [Cutaneotrichosporon sp. HIS471]
MAITTLTLDARRPLADVNLRVAKARRVVVVSGAGISCSSGIPDFRSGNGLYSLVKTRYPESFVTGKDLFSSGLFSTPETTSIFYTFIAELSLACQAAEPTRTHHFIRRLEAKGKLLRSYTQNVDGFERRLGLESGGRGTGLKKNGTRNVELHGDLGRVRCVLCFADFEACDEYVCMFREGEAPNCPSCEVRHADRVNRGARATSVGTLRPSIVLYDEAHPLGDQIGELQAHDMKRRPDMLLIMGTSLKVHGLKHLIKDFAKVVHERKGIVVFVNATTPNKEWESVIDYHVQGPTDEWVDLVQEDWKKARPQDWELQTTLDPSIVHKSVVKGKSKAKAKSKAKPKPLPSSDDACHLPTPPNSQQSPISSPRGSTRNTPQRDSSTLPPTSSPLTPVPTPPVSPSPFKTLKVPATPYSPASPSKRSASRTGVPEQAKRSRTRPASPSPSPGGRGNTLVPITNTLATDDEDDDEDDDALIIPAKPRLTRTPSLPPMPSRKAKAAASQAWLGLAPQVMKKQPKENSSGQSPQKRVAADKRCSTRPTRVPSLRAP